MPVIRIAVSVAAVLLATACGTQVPQDAAQPPTTGGPTATAEQQTTTEQPSAAPTTETAAQPSGQPPAQAPEQLRFTAKTVDGQDFDAAMLAGKPAVLWFWAAWCPTCNREAPWLREVAAANAGSVTFVGVAGLSETPAMKQFVEKHSLNFFVHLADTDGSLWRRFGVTHQPAYAFVDAAGQVQVEKHELSREELTARVTGLSGR